MACKSFSCDTYCTQYCTIACNLNWILWCKRHILQLGMEQLCMCYALTSTHTHIFDLKRIYLFLFLFSAATSASSSRSSDSAAVLNASNSRKRQVPDTPLDSQSASVVSFASSVYWVYKWNAKNQNIYKRCTKRKDITLKGHQKTKQKCDSKITFFKSGPLYNDSVLV